MTEEFDEIPRIPEATLTSAVTICVPVEMKTMYAKLVNHYKVDSAELLRRKFIAELGHMIEAGIAGFEDPDPEDEDRMGRGKRSLTLWVDESSYRLFEEIRTKYPKIRRGWRLRAAYDAELRRALSIVGDISQAS